MTSVGETSSLEEQIKSLRLQLDHAEIDISNAATSERARIVQATMEYESGCKEGKIAFLNDIGWSQWRKPTDWEVKFRIDLDPDVTMDIPFSRKLEEVLRLVEGVNFVSCEDWDEYEG